MPGILDVRRRNTGCDTYNHTSSDRLLQAAAAATAKARSRPSAHAVVGCFLKFAFVNIFLLQFHHTKHNNTCTVSKCQRNLLLVKSLPAILSLRLCHIISVDHSIPETTISVLLSLILIMRRLRWPVLSVADDGCCGWHSCDTHHDGEERMSRGE